MTKFIPTELSGGLGSQNTINQNFDDLATFSDNTISRDGTAPNTMQADFDMGDNQILNVEDATTDSMAATYGQVKKKFAELQRPLQVEDEDILLSTFNISAQGLMGLVSAGNAVVGETYRTKGSLAEGDLGHTTWKCEEVGASLPGGATALVTVDSEIAYIYNDSGISYLYLKNNEDTYDKFTNLADTINANQFGGTVSTVNAPNLIPTLSKMRSGEQFNLADAFSTSDYEDIRNKTNTTDYSDLINEVLSDSTNIYIPKGRWYAGDLQPQSHSVFEGAGWGAYSVGVEGNTVFYLPAGKTGFMDFNGVNNLTLNNFTVNAQSNGDGFYTDGGGNHFYMDQIKVFNAATCVRGNGGNPLSDLHTTRCVFRESSAGVSYVQDSSFSANTTFSSLRFRGMLLEGGQIRIVDCFFEWMHNDKQAVNAIETFGNLNELTVSSCQFDRISGHSIKFSSGASTNTRHINIIGNQFKRGAWGEDLPSSQRYDIYQTAGTVEDVDIRGNVWERGNHGASSIQGIVSPNGAYYLDNVDRATIGLNHTQDLENYIYFESDPTNVFIQSAANTNEYHTNIEYSQKPDVVRLDYVGLSEGTVGSLAQGEWGWGNIDGFERNRLYVREASDTDPTTLSTLTQANDFQQTVLNGNNIQTTEFRDRAVISTVANGDEHTRTLRTRTSLIDNFERSFVGSLEITGWQEGDSVISAGVARFNFSLTRSSGVNVGIVEGNIEDLDTSGFSMGWASGATGAVRIAINPVANESDPNGNFIRVRVTGHSASSIRDLKIRLRW